MADRIAGSLVGGAAGDALGYVVEFMNEASIFRKFGSGGIRDYVLSGGVAPVSDDTQMTVATAVGLLGSDSGIEKVKDAYLDWYDMQHGGKIEFRVPEMASFPGLGENRAPGNTCLTALSAISRGKEPFNNSKGCGGVMRVAPVAMYGAVNAWTASEVMKFAAQAARLTHLHSMGYVPAGVVAVLIYRLLLDEAPTASALRAYCFESCSLAEEIYTGSTEAFSPLVEEAVALAGSDLPDLECIHRLGEGWVGDEASAIAIFCSLRHFYDFGRALESSVNHNGDSDSTGAVTGNILGAALGYEAIPKRFKDKLELHGELLALSCRIADKGGC